jgi:hypothetical protein
MKAYVYEVATAVVLLGIVEIYLWSQSRDPMLDSAAAKYSLIALYVLIACASQYAISSWLKYRLQDALKANLLVAAIISLGVVALAFSVHPGIVKDVPRDVLSMAGAWVKFFSTIGLVTVGLRMIVAVLVRSRESALRSPNTGRSLL